MDENKETDIQLFGHGAGGDNGPAGERFGCRQQNYELNAYVESTYTLTIPSKTEIVFNSTSTDLNGTLKVTGNVRPMQKVTVKAELNALHNAVQNTNLPYKLMSGAVEFQAADWSETELRAAEPKELQLSVDIAAEDWNQAKGGEYQGNIVFTAELIRE